MTYVIRSMSTTDYVSGADGRPRAQPVPYHTYLKRPGERAGAWWTQSLSEAMRFETIEEAEAEWLRHWSPTLLSNQDIAPIGCPMPVWEARHHQPGSKGEPTVDGLTERQKMLLSALASTAGYTEERMRDYLARKYPALPLVEAMSKEIDSI